MKNKGQVKNQKEFSILKAGRKAIDYTLPRWKGLSAYAHNGSLEIDNNLVENTI